MSATHAITGSHRQLSFRSAFATEAERKRENLSECPRIPSPYLEGSRLSLSLTCHALKHTSIVVEVVKAFTPFTCSQTLLVHPVSSSSPSVCLPGIFILKFADVRFTPRADTPQEESYAYTWTYDTREAFVEGARRVRNHEWGNEWTDYIPDGRPYLPGESKAGDDDESDITLWSYEMGHYYSVQAFYDREEQAYHALGSLQGRDIPRLLGTVSLETGDLEPLLSSIRGLALEYIDGQTLANFKLGESISTEQAERVSQATLQAVRCMRDCLIVHNDLALRNIMVRCLRPGSNNFDFNHPVIIDFGLSGIYSLEHDDYETLVDHLRTNVNDVRHMFYYADWHIQSLYLGAYQPDKLTGYARANRLIDRLDAETRARNFEEISAPEREVLLNAIDEDGVAHMHVYEPARWKLRKGVHGKDADMNWEPLRPSGTV
ncbi:hypothetical protein PENSPDRAFT_688082 [Peniophora sp. CONT]|nr:hypothetical protein PENSPDRAFT_688082 [Peniophora sp. CONT]